MKTLVFIDDDKYEMMPYVERLRQEGFTVEFFTEPEDAMKYFASHPQPSVIIADLIMRTSPEQSLEDAHYSGVTLCRDVREQLKYTCPIIAFSVVSEPEIEATVKKYANVFLNKPILPGDLVRRAKTLLTK